MSQRFLAFFFFILLFIFLLFLILKLVIPIWQLMLKADTIFYLYDNLFKVLLKRDFSTNEKISFNCGDYLFKFSNTNEASMEFEKIVQEALAYYNNFDWIIKKDYSLQEKKDKLVDICCEVRALRWQKQGI